MALIYNATFDKNTRKLSFEDKAGNEIYSFTVPERVPAVDDITKPLTFRATQDGSTVKLAKYVSPTGAFQTSRDGGNTWTDYTLDTAITLNTGDEVSFRAKADRTSGQNDLDYFYFEMTGKIEAWHNVMSLYRTSDFATYESVVQYAFYKLFKGCTSLTKAPVLPATTLAQSCYYNMFDGCTSLTEATALPATTLALQCYYGMFSGCTSLTKAPALPATTLTNRCYSNMFKGCTSLVNAPELSSTTLADFCYDGMFEGCTSLTEAPELTATKLANRCYQGMFQGCTSLAKAPELPATTLVDYCYQMMFKGCTSLNEVRCQMPSTISTEDIPTYTGEDFYAWLYGVSPTGTFHTNYDANWPSGASGIPEGWTRVNEGAPAVDDITKPLTFKATQDSSTVKLTKWGTPSGDFQMSRDGGNTWSDYTTGTSIALNTDDEVSFRAKADRTSVQTSNNYFYFEMTGKIEAWHNVMSLYRTNDFSTYNTVVGYAFRTLFKDCVSLTKAPALPATTLANNCYHSMFYGCQSLTKAPRLPATTLAPYCYNSMFFGCTSLTKAPVLPSTTLENFCYYKMFIGCQSLAEAPALPATTLANNCYKSMFQGCTSLTKAPELPATTLASGCYISMFRDCSSLNKVHCDIPSSYSADNITSYADSWLSGVASTGTFYTNADANWPSGTSGIPTGWTRVPEGAPATSDITKPLTFRATQNGSTVSLKKNGSPEGASFQTSGDGGNTWVDYTIGTVIPLSAGDKVSFRAKYDREFEQSNSKYFQFNMTGKIEAWHNVMSLYRTNDFATYESVLSFAFYYLFKDCTSLTKAPRLPATTLAKSCYYRMFMGCTSLTKAPYLPATSLAETCYWGMFSGCTSLTEDPVLSATRLGTRCYNQMFDGCSSLNKVHCDIPSSYSTEYVSAHADGWLSGVASTGTFYTNADANWPSGSVSGIPEGWTRVND